MERSDLLDMNGQIFEAQGKALDKVRVYVFALS
jgi:malate/lactate dehydrogenase